MTQVKDVFLFMFRTIQFTLALNRGYRAAVYLPAAHDVAPQECSPDVVLGNEQCHQMRVKTTLWQS